jgi:hypothetical protein
MIVSLFYKTVGLFCRLIGISYSFSYDGEDFALLKYLRGIKNGFFIDIGSHKPVKSSNTFLLHTLGWTGCCVDPLPTLRKSYSLLRRRDLFINAGIVPSENKDQQFDFYFYKRYPDNSTFDPIRVEQLKKLFNRYPTCKISVPLLSTEELFLVINKRFRNKDDIHLLSIDTEGFEKSILEDFFSLGKFPWIICVEELGKTLDDLIKGDLYNLMTENGYILGAKTFLSSIYIKKDKFAELPSPFVRELIL